MSANFTYLEFIQAHYAGSSVLTLQRQQRRIGRIVQMQAMTRRH
jgi:hypothetical protein